MFLSILCSIKIEWLLFLKFLKHLAFFDSYFWPFNKTHEKIIAIFVISAIMSWIWNVFKKFRWHDEKLNPIYYLNFLTTIYLGKPWYCCLETRDLSRDWRELREGALLAACALTVIIFIKFLPKIIMPDFRSEPMELAWSVGKKQSKVNTISGWHLNLLV